MRVLAVEGTPGQRLVDVLEPMSADEIGVVGDGAKVTGVRGVAFALSTRTDEAFPKQSAIGRAEMKLADQSRFAERMETRPFASAIGECSLVKIEADDVTPQPAGFDRFGCPPGETAAEVEMVRIVTV